MNSFVGYIMVFILVIVALLVGAITHEQDMIRGCVTGGELYTWSTLVEPIKCGRSLK